jgi:hypothetical protein
VLGSDGAFVVTSVSDPAKAGPHEGDAKIAKVAQARRTRIDRFIFAPWCPLSLPRLRIEAVR